MPYGSQLISEQEIMNRSFDPTNNVAKQAEQFAPVAEDNSLGVYATQIKPSADSQYAYTQFSDLGANITLTVKAAEGNVFSVDCQNENVADRYFQIHNLAVAATTTVSVPAHSWLVPAGEQIIIGTDFFGPAGLNFGTGITFAFSTTKDVYTAAVATDQTSHVNYK